MASNEGSAGSDPATTKGDDDGKKMVPLDALEAERAKRHDLERRVAGMQGQLQGLKDATSAQAAPAEEPLTAAELRTAVEQGKITQAEADDLRDRQLEDRLTSRLTGALESTLSARDISSRVDTDIARYKAAIPEIDESGSAQREKVQREYDYLVGMGHKPDDLRTELLAVRSAFGPIDDLERVRVRERETHGETGGK